MRSNPIWTRGKTKGMSPKMISEVNSSPNPSWPLYPCCLLRQNAVLWRPEASYEFVTLGKIFRIFLVTSFWSSRLCIVCVKCWGRMRNNFAPPSPPPPFAAASPVEFRTRAHSPHYPRPHPSPSSPLTVLRNIRELKQTRTATAT